MGEMAAPERLHQPKRERATRKNLDLRISRVWRTGIPKIELPGKQIAVVPQQKRGVTFGQHFQPIVPPRSQPAPTEWRPSSKKSTKFSARGGIFGNLMADSIGQILS